MNNNHGAGIKSWGLVLTLVVGATALAGAQSDVKVYRVPKEPSPAPAAKPAGGLVPVSESVLPRLTWKTPAGWTELPPGQMRAASFKLQADDKMADVSVIPLPGAAGGDLPNVNRWRGQVGLEPVTADELTKSAGKLEIAGQPALLHEMAGKNPGSGEATRILGAIQHRDGMAWFFKMTGDDELVGKNRAAFQEFLQSVKFEAPKPGELPADHPPVEPASLPAGHPPVEPASLPAGHPEIGAAVSDKTEASTERQLRWSVPTGWKEIPGGQFLYAKFSIPGEGGTLASVNVSTSVGDGGGLAANVNRWRGQLGLAAWSEAELQKQLKTMDAAGGKIMLVEMSGTDARSAQAVALVGAVTKRGDSTWFYKLMGDAKIVAAQKQAFIGFVKEVKY